MRDILVELGVDADHDDDVSIGGSDYNHHVMEDSYYETYQIKSKEGDLLFFDMVTYGYGEAIAWEKLEAQKQALEEWARGVCERHHCSYEIRMCSNYW